MTRQKLTMMILLVALIVPGVLVAQPPDGGPGNGGGNGNGGGRGLLAELLPPPGYLQLTEEQREGVQGLAVDLRDALEPIREDQAATGEALRAELDKDDPNPTTVGQLTLDLRALGQEMRGALGDFEASFRDILTAEQQTKWDHFQELRRLSRRQAQGGNRQGPPTDGIRFRRGLRGQ